jgi:hypothetical protein
MVADEPVTLVQVRDSTFNIVPLEAALDNNVLAVVFAGAKYPNPPYIAVTFTMFGFAIYFSYPNTIAIAIALPVEAPPKLVKAVEAVVAPVPPPAIWSTPDEFTLEPNAAKLSACDIVYPWESCGNSGA